MVKETRRKLFVQAAGIAAAVQLAPLLGRSAGLAGLAPVARADTLPLVAVARGAKADSASAYLKTALDAIGGIGRFVKSGNTVCIKPNATWAYPPGTASSTDPDLLRALITLCREAGAKKIVVVDHCSIDPGAAECLRVSGIGDVVDEMKVDSVFVDRYERPKGVFTQIDLPKGKAFHSLGVFKAAIDADVRINMGLAKSHWVTKFVLTLKHMMGFLEEPGALHAQLEQGIADLNTESQIQAQLHILEAFKVRTPVPGEREAAGGAGDEITDPARVKVVNELLAGTDAVLMDSYGLTEYFDRKGEELAHVKAAFDTGLGEIDVDKATADGRLRLYTVGQAQPTRAATVAASATPGAAASPSGATASTTSAGPAVTATPRPTATLDPAAQSRTTTAGRVPEGVSTSASSVINPNPILSGALVPAAVIAAGVGVVLRRRMRKGEAEAEAPKRDE